MERVTKTKKYILPILITLSILFTCGGGGSCQQYNPDTDQYERVECPKELQDGNEWIIGKTHIEKK